MDDGLTPKERADEMRLAILIYRIAKWTVFAILAALIIGSLYSCSTQKIVPVP
jgi:hypothetical protein